MDEIVAWLRGVLADDEKKANAAAFCSSPEWVAIGSLLLELHGDVAEPEIIEATHYGYDDALIHAARHDPRQVLADIAAKRAILDLHDQSGVRWVGFPRADRQESYCVHDQQAAPCHTVRLLASAYRHRPGWRAEWER